MPRRLSKPENDAFLGRGGEGKSTLVRELTRRERRVLIFDAAREPDNEAGATVIDEPDLASAKLALVDALKGNSVFRIAMRYPKGQHPLPYFEWLNRAALEVGDCRVIWEEANTVFKQGMPPFAFTIMHQGRHDGVRLTLVSRRPVYLTDPLNLATSISSFRMTGEGDVKKLAQYVGREAAEATMRLAPRHYVRWTEQDWKICKPVKISAGP